MTTPASYSPGANDAFASGVNHMINPGRANSASITLGGSLQADSTQRNGMSPHGVLATAAGAGSQDDSPWERLQRDAGSYAPGSVSQLQDQLSNGDNDNAE